MKVDQVRDSVSCRVDEVRYFVKMVDVVRVDQMRVDQVGCSPIYIPNGRSYTCTFLETDVLRLNFTWAEVREAREPVN